VTINFILILFVVYVVCKIFTLKNPSFYKMDFIIINKEPIYFSQTG